jgi:hypothetical protein
MPLQTPLGLVTHAKNITPFGDTSSCRLVDTTDESFEAEKGKRRAEEERS